MITNFQPKSAVKTFDKAKELLNDLKETEYIEDIHEGSCECGTTCSVVAYNEKHKSIAYVLVCESCGDDNGFDVLQKYN